ncbi:hypothetical protein BDW74DRAFT_119873 [Aspergillus multicolor]|uniref:uncharacterized protein n=1 Tax=Aspergillus multicolor TaxID=41759 RepID=UPI003CCD5F34
MLGTRQLDSGQAHDTSFATANRITEITSESKADVPSAAITNPNRSRHALVEPSSKGLSHTQHQQCTVKQCHCSCHATQRLSARFWQIRYTPLSTFFKNCDNSQCSARRYRWSFRLALTKYGIPLSLIGGLEYISGAGTYSLRPVLVAQYTVKYTSPGFEALWRFQNDLQSLLTTKAQFRDLCGKDSSLRYHCQPSWSDLCSSIAME